MMRVIQARECSVVERAHTLPHHGSYTNGQHSHDAVSLYLILCPDPKLEVVKAIHVHDYGERWCGDLPAPTKWAQPEIGRLMHNLEMHCLDRMGFHFFLDEQDTMWLKAVDSLELWLWAWAQIAIGNTNAVAVIGNLNAYFERTELPPEVIHFIKTYKWTRTADIIPK